jgi:hypothetical protein
MCVFCAAAPTVAAIGGVAQGKERERIKQAIEHGETRARPRPIGAISAFLILFIFIASAIYHTHQPS